MSSARWSASGPPGFVSAAFSRSVALATRSDGISDTITKTERWRDLGNNPVRQARTHRECGRSHLIDHRSCRRGSDKRIRRAPGWSGIPVVVGNLRAHALDPQHPGTARPLLVQRELASHCGHQHRRFVYFGENERPYRCTTSSEMAVRHTPKWLFVFAPDTHVSPLTGKLPTLRQFRGPCLVPTARRPCRELARSRVIGEGGDDASAGVARADR